MKLLSTDLNKALTSIYTENYIGEEKMKYLIENQKTEIQAGQDAYIETYTVDQMEKLVEEELVNDYGLHIKDVLLETNDQFGSENLEEFIEQVTVILTEKTTEATETTTIEVIEKVDVDLTEKEVKEAPPKGVESEIQKFLSEKWQLPNDKVVVRVEGG
jgi:hypothetical protein